MTDPFTPEFVITLNRYQLDNLRWLLHLTGYREGERVEPFHLADSGDWLGELYWKLNDVAPDMENDAPNRKPGETAHYVKIWVVDQCD